jgi:uncharacterized RmlC-like cupin family protein
MTDRLDQITVVSPDERTPGPPTAGMDRQQAFATDTLWAGLDRTDAGMMSGWHHHGEHETVIYVVSGDLRMEFGADGERTADAGPGDFVRVPKRVVHRESNPSAAPADVIVFRSGSGETLVNVDGPG